MTLVNLVSKLLALGTIIGQLFLLASAVYIIFLRKKYPAILRFLGNNGLLLAFLVALSSVIASLFYSEIAGFLPCDLCWFQRIFMYPQVLILGIALIKKDYKVTIYAASLAVVGGIISLYHNYIYYFNSGLDAYCQVASHGVSCVKRYIFEFGYVTIPIMALTAFALILMLLLFHTLSLKADKSANV